MEQIVQNYNMKQIISILGKTNVGKSSLFNKIIEKKYSPISNKKNTTSRLIKGISNNHIIIDTPGPITKYFKTDQKSKNAPIYYAIKKSKTIIITLNKKLSANDFFILELTKKIKKDKILVINKSDQIKKKDTLLPIIKNFVRYGTFKNIIPLSTKNNLNIEKLYNILFEKKINFKTKLIQNEILLVIKDITKKELIKLYNKEIPHSIKIKIESTKNNKEIIIILETKKKNHKQILIGKNGTKIKNMKTNIEKDFNRINKNNVTFKIIIK